MNVLIKDAFDDGDEIFDGIATHSDDIIEIKAINAKLPIVQLDGVDLIDMLFMLKSNLTSKEKSMLEVLVNDLQCQDNKENE